MLVVVRFSSRSIADDHRRIVIPIQRIDRIQRKLRSEWFALPSRRRDRAKSVLAMPAFLVRNHLLFFARHSERHSKRVQFRRLLFLARAQRYLSNLPASANLRPLR